MCEGYFVFVGRILAVRRSLDHVIGLRSAAIGERQWDEFNRRWAVEQNRGEKSQMREHRRRDRTMLAEASGYGLSFAKHAIHTLS